MTTALSNKQPKELHFPSRCEVVSSVVAETQQLPALQIFIEESHGQLRPEELVTVTRGRLHDGPSEALNAIGVGHAKEDEM